MNIEKKEKLEKQVFDGELAASSQYILEKLLQEIIENCKEDFINLPIFDNQNLDNRAILVLKLKIAIAQEMISKIRNYITKGLEAKKKLDGDSYHE